jgi:hypothetical protein
MLDIRAQSLSVLDLTHAILTAAQAEQWDDVPGLEERRQRVLDQIFAGEVRGEEETLFLAGVIEQVREMDRTIGEMARRERDQIAAELKRLRGAQRREQAYLDVAGESME